MVWQKALIIMEQNEIVFQDHLEVFVSWTRLPLFSNLSLDTLVIFYLIRVVYQLFLGSCESEGTL